MRYFECFEDYELIDTSRGEKLERWGDVLLIRPDPQIIWNTSRDGGLWDKADARYIRSSTGGGYWEIEKPIKDQWVIRYKNLRFVVRPTGFKHTGLFPEQAVNWDLVSGLIKESGRNVSVLNLFAYTGAATLACAEAGASVCHVDASKGMTAWARENAAISSLSDKPIRWIVDDCIKFAARELRRGVRYDAIIMDPPSYGRGPGGETWKLEDNIYELLELCTGLLSENPLFFLLNSYTTGLTAGVMSYLMEVSVGKRFTGKIAAEEIGIPVTTTKSILPCGNTALWQRR